MYRSTRPPIADALSLAIALVWAGMLIGVSFVATPIKFSAPGLSLPVALEVGRVTFHLFTRIEWGLAAVLFLASVSGTSWVRSTLAVLLAGVVVAQAAWLLPALDARLAATVAGNPPPPSSYHMLYALAEAAKLLLLVAAGVFGLRAWGLGRR